MSQLYVSHGQYYLTSEDVHGSDADENDDGTVDGLTMASPDAIQIMTGTHTGTIDLDVQLLAHEPDPDYEWDVIVERSFSTASGARQIWDTDNEPQDQYPTIPASGLFRLRASARHRDSARFEKGPTEQHLLQIWPVNALTPGTTFEMDETGQIWLNPEGSGPQEDTPAPGPLPAARVANPPSRGHVL